MPGCPYPDACPMECPMAMYFGTDYNVCLWFKVGHLGDPPRDNLLFAAHPARPFHCSPFPSIPLLFFCDVCIDLIDRIGTSRMSSNMSVVSSS